jgi:hypothetical protein
MVNHDMTALIAIYDATNGAGWLNKDGWDRTSQRPTPTMLDASALVMAPRSRQARSSSRIRSVRDGLGEHVAVKVVCACDTSVSAPSPSLFGPMVTRLLRLKPKPHVLAMSSRDSWPVSPPLKKSVVTSRWR